MHWYLDVLKNYTGFTGRARRTELWMFWLVNLGIVIALSIVEGIIGMPGILSGLYNLAVLLPTIAVGMRRLHDTDRSGWWLLIAFIPFLGGIVLLIFFCLEGTKGDNQYGPDPKA
ncbi:MAG: DUF805 domain-containing protein [Candidatus Hydrogenedentes bacterium]|nr:DUF805 domain-containing protein [Candidatus Hydrogenedentota bacterium]